MNVNKKISVIIPFLNEEENIELLVNSLDDFFIKSKLDNCEVVFIDDGSTDNSINIFLNHLKNRSFDAKIVKLSKNEGAHCAVRAGLIHTTGDYAVFLPADLQDPLELIITLANKLEEGFDIVFASRENTGTGILRSIATKIYANLMRKYVHKNYPLNGFDVVFFNRKIINKLNENIEANSSVMLQIMTLGYRQAFISYKKEIRKKGKSKWTLSKKIKLFIDSFIAFSYAPIRFVTLVGILLFILGMFFSIYLIYIKLKYNDLITGWPTLISILLLGFGITNISLGIIAEYLWRTLDSSRKRPVFIVDEIINLNQIHE